MPFSVSPPMPRRGIRHLKARAMSRSLPPMRQPLWPSRLCWRSARSRHCGPINSKEQSVVPPPISTTSTRFSSLRVASKSSPAATGSNWKTTSRKPARRAARSRIPCAWAFASSPPRPWKLIGRPITAWSICSGSWLSACSLMCSIMAQTRSSNRATCCGFSLLAPRKDFGDLTK